MTRCSLAPAVINGMFSIIDPTTQVHGSGVNTSFFVRPDNRRPKPTSLWNNEGLRRRVLTIPFQD